MLTIGADPVAQRKTVYYEGTSTIYEGMPVCYNHDATTNWWGASITSGVATEQTTTAEGLHNEGKYILVENPATANFSFLAGFVADWDRRVTAGPCALDIYVPNDATVLVRTNANCTVGVTPLALSNATQHLVAYTGSGPVVAIAMETVDRSGTTGLVLAKILDAARGLASIGGYLAPKRAVTTGDAYGVRIVLDDLYTGAGATGPRTWGVGITGDKESGAIITAGADDAAFRVNVSNYVANEEIFNWRGINVVSNNRDGGTVGELDNVISVSAKQGSTNAKIIGLQVDAQSLSADTADEMVGLDVSLNREGGVSTEEAGIRIRTRGTINTAVNTAIRVDKGATDHGFINLFNIETDAVDVIDASGDITFTSADKLIPIVFNGSTYYLVATDNV